MNVTLLVINIILAVIWATVLANNDKDRGLNGFFLGVAVCSVIDSIQKLAA